MKEIVGILCRTLWHGETSPLLDPLSSFLTPIMLLGEYTSEIEIWKWFAKALHQWKKSVNKVIKIICNLPLFRSKAKQGYLPFFRIVFDALGRTTLVFTWVTLNNPQGNFQPLHVFFIYYGMFLLLLVFNVVFNTSQITCSLSYILGELIF